MRYQITEQQGVRLSKIGRKLSKLADPIGDTDTRRLIDAISVTLHKLKAGVPIKETTLEVIKYAERIEISAKEKEQ